MNQNLLAIFGIALALLILGFIIIDQYFLNKKKYKKSS